MEKSDHIALVHFHTVLLLHSFLLHVLSQLLLVLCPCSFSRAACSLVAVSWNFVFCSEAWHVISALDIVDSSAICRGTSVTSGCRHR